MKKTKNILLAIGCSKIGGAQKVFITIAKKLRKEGNIVTVLLPEGALAVLLRNENFNTISINYKSIKGIRTIAGLLKRKDFDIINTHLTNSSFLFAVINIFYKKKLCCSLHNAIIHEGLNKLQKLIYPFIYFLIYKLSNGIIVNSESNKQHFIDIAHISPKHIRVIYNGIDASEYIVEKNLSKNRGGKFQIGFIGRLSIEKGVIYLIEALSQLTEIDYECVIIGEGPLRYVLEEKVLSKGLKSRIKFLGFQKNVTPFFAQMDVFILPSLNEVLPITIIEAFALKVVTIAAEVGGVPDLITHGKTGMLYPTRDIEKLSENIKWVYKNNSESQKMVENAYAKFIQSFSSDVMIREISEYFDIINKN
ncbi:glycosyltransferase family 4 protein [Sediminibacterium sp.]|uniref:glycosyltransferase family 4 protein n=1 Tax=Sediminibacterium sp. TaxID=1917865 RepID=UPI0025F21CC1|nr:glycosyltransferase family 4 protein [Sediminibacterium sp.]MBT9485467.1 glycosyltransferase family 4 protein [Sediminibacterium sp.]